MASDFKTNTLRSTLDRSCLYVSQSPLRPVLAGVPEAYSTVADTLSRRRQLGEISHLTTRDTVLTVSAEARMMQ